LKISWMNARLIWVAPECRDMGGPTCLYHGTLGWKRIYERDRKKKKARNGSSLYDLCRSCRVASHCWLIGISSSKIWKLCTAFIVVGMMDRLPCCLTTSVGLTLLMCGLGPHSQRVGHCMVHMVKKAEAHSTSHIILVVGFETLLQFSSTVPLAMCQTIHLALSFFSELGQKLPSLTTDLEYSSCPHCP
jgi:hypothetical protein